MNSHKSALFTFFCFILIQFSTAQTPYSAEVSYRSLGSNQYLVQLEVFRKCGGATPASQLMVDYVSTSCGIIDSLQVQQVSVTDITPVCPTGTSPCASGYGLLQCIYADTITFSPCSDWVISYEECCRDSAMFTIQSADTTSIYSYATLDNSSQDNNLAIFTNAGYVYTCVGNQIFYSPGAYDIDGDSLHFSLVNHLGANGDTLSTISFFSFDNTFGTDPLILFTDRGEFTTNPTSLGSRLVSIQVDEYRNGTLIASSYKDVIIAVDACFNMNPFSTSIHHASSARVLNVQGGFLKDNIFYVDDPVGLTFDIPIFDFIPLNDTINVSSDITILGGSYTVAVGPDTATASFTWPKSSPILQEFMINVVDSYCDTFAAGGFMMGYAIKSIDCIPRPIQEIVAVDSVVTFCPTCASGTILNLDAIFSSLTTSHGSLSLNANGCIEYQASSIYEVQDTFWVYFGGNGGSWMDSIWVDIITTSCVWAGDADTNKVVNNFDLLPIGLGFGEVGPVRANADLSYDCEPNLNFSNNTPTTNINYKHSDTDGNGIVNSDDTLAVTLNWGQVHLKSNPSSSSQTGIPFYVDSTSVLAGQVVQVPIVLGSFAVVADSIYGLAFTINYNQTMVDSGSVFIDFNNSWLGAINSDMIMVQKDFYAQGQIQVGLTRTNQNNQNGMGQIGAFNLGVKNNLLATKRLNLSISNIRIIANDERQHVVNSIPSDILVTVLNGQKELVVDQLYLNVFPNPTQNVLNIQSNDKIEQIDLYNLTGQSVQTIESGNYQEQLNLKDLNQGIYLLKVRTTHTFYTEKIQIL
jgi:hypothetical protein